MKEIHTLRHIIKKTKFNNRKRSQNVDQSYSRHLHNIFFFERYKTFPRIFGRVFYCRWPSTLIFFFLSLELRESYILPREHNLKEFPSLEAWPLDFSILLPREKYFFECLIRIGIWLALLWIYTFKRLVESVD